MMIIAFSCLGNSIIGKTLRQMACLSLLWIVRQETNTRILRIRGDGKGRMGFTYFHSSL